MVGGELHASGHFTSGKDPRIHWIGRWMGCRTGFYAEERRKIYTSGGN
jgi:hypothetical protein